MPSKKEKEEKKEGILDEDDLFLQWKYYCTPIKTKSQSSRIKFVAR